MADTTPPFEECDAGGCPARAYHEIIIDVTLPSLFFCNHHSKQYERALMMQAVEWIDRSAALRHRARPDASA